MPRATRYSVTLIAWSLLISLAHAEPLTIERIFAAPDLSGPTLRNTKISPDGKYVTYLQGKTDNKDQLDLWGADVRTGRTRMLIDSRAFVPEEEKLSAEEAARRERQRTATLRGIVEYQFSKDGRRLLAPLGGDLYVYDLKARSGARVQRLTRSDSYETDARFSPKGRYVSFIRDQNLWIVELASGIERQLTRDGAHLVSFGVAEFVAQEEMGRNTGYWWSPDESRIAFTRIDDAPVKEVERFEIYAQDVKTVRQRYPAAGAPNAHVELWVMDLATGATRQLPYGNQPDDYLARVDWFPDSSALAVQTQARNQQRLDLVKLDARDGRRTILLTERSDTWLNLGENLAFVPKRHAFVWASERTGFRHLYLYNEDGQLLRSLTAGAWTVMGDVTEDSIDETRGLIYFSANEATPLEQHLYSASLDTAEPAHVQRISREPGWHDAHLLPNRRAYLDSWTAPDQPSSVAIRNVDGSLRSWLSRNALDATHPFARYLDHRPSVEFGSLRASDDQTLYYRLIKPKDFDPKKRYPVVVDWYGGPTTQYVTHTWQAGPQGYFRQILTQQGFIVFSLDNRGSDNRGAAFAAPIHRRLGKVEIEDQVRGVEFLKTLPFVDGDRIGGMGWSYGGYTTLMALATAPQVFKAGVSGAPVTDWRLYDTHYTERYMGTPADNAEGYAASSLTPYLKNISGKLLLVHGMADDNVLFANSTSVMKQLQDADIQFDLMTYPGGKHGLTRDPLMGRHFYEGALKFFLDNL